VAATAVLLTIVLALKRNHLLTFCLTLLGIVVAFAALFLVSPAISRQVGLLFVVDGFGIFYSALVLAAGFCVTILSFDYLKGREGRQEEFYILLLGALLGALALISSRHFISFFLGLEVLSISLYPLIAYQRAKPRHIEAGIKYLILSGVSSSFLLFGMAIIYAITGDMEFPVIGQRMDGLVQGQTMMLVGMLLLIIGVGFKLGVVPFHMWTPDVYEGAPAPVTAFIATVSKGAVFALLLRYFIEVNLVRHSQLVAVFTIIAIASMVAGNLLALFQNNVKRLLAYSSIAHFGYLLVAFLAAGSPLRVTSVTYYLVAYFITTIGAFGVVTLLSSKENDADAIGDYEGLSRRHPWLAGAFTLMLLSLVGMPLTAGFIAKVYIVAAGVGTMLWLPVIVLIVTSVIGLFYYLRVIAAIYRPPLRVLPRSCASGLQGKVLMAVLAVLLVWWGIYPAPLINLIEMVAGGR
jgi:NADH-quinone oxidoreductase subunit N